MSTSNEIESKPAVGNCDFEFPVDWNDDTRANALFAPFREKSLDTAAWTSKMTYWTDLIYKYLLHSKTPSFSLSSLKKAFTRKGKCPYCLESVLVQLKINKEISPTSEYEKLTNDSTTTWLIKSLVRSPLSWVISKVTGPMEESPNTEFTHLAVAQAISREFEANLSREKRGKLILLRDFEPILNKNVLIVLKTMILESKAAVISIGQDLVVKFAKEGEKKVVVTEVDKGIFQLERNELHLSNCIQNLELERENALIKVKSCLKEQKKVTAKSWLRRKIQLEKYIEKRSNALENIRTLLDQLKSVEHDSIVLESYKLGVIALKKSLAENGLTEEMCEKTMDDLQDARDITMDIERTLARPIDEADDGDLENELSAILNDDNDGKGDGGDNDESLDLPDVPAQQPEDHDDVAMRKRLEALYL